jgi:hypothetical protein
VKQTTHSPVIAYELPGKGVTMSVGQRREEGQETYKHK